MFNNANLLWFDQTAVLEQFLFDGHIHASSASTSAPASSTGRWSARTSSSCSAPRTLIQGQGIRNLYNNVYDRVDPFVQAFGTLVLTY